MVDIACIGRQTSVYHEETNTIQHQQLRASGSTAQNCDLKRIERLHSHGSGADDVPVPDGSEDEHQVSCDDRMSTKCGRWWRGRFCSAPAAGVAKSSGNQPHRQGAQCPRTCEHPNAMHSNNHVTKKLSQG